VIQPGPGILHASGQEEVPQVLADDFRVAVLIASR
jgi:hypothetical protein